MKTTPLELIVDKVQQDGTDVRRIELRAASGADLPAFTAGAHLNLRTPGGLTRPYSLCNPPSERSRYMIAVLREEASRGGSRSMHEQVASGDRLLCDPPLNHFALDESAAHSILLAGGIGITPILAMAERLSELGASFELHRCCRSPARAPLRGRLLTRPFSDRVTVYYSEGDDARRLDIAALLATPRPDTHIYACGPSRFMSAVLESAASAGWADDRVHREYFAADPVHHDSDAAFEIRLASSGRVVPVHADESIVAALARAGVSVDTSCEQGVCGTCLTRVLEGRPDHRDMYLTTEEQARNDQMLPCCSRSLSPVLVLDL